MQSVHITTKVVSSNHAHGVEYSIQHYVIFLSVTCGKSSVFSAFSWNNKTDRHDIAEILLKVALNTITLTLTSRDGCFDSHE